MQQEGRKRLSSKLGNRLTGYSITAGAVLVAGAQAQGVVSYSGVQNIDLVGGSGGNEYALDMNSDGVEEFKFSHRIDTYTSSSIAMSSSARVSAYRPFGNSGDVAVIGGRARKFSASETISSSVYGWQWHPDIGILHKQINSYYFSFSTGSFLDSAGYIGVRFDDVNDDMRYGWILYMHTGWGAGRIVSWAYEEIPGAPILAGDIGTCVDNDSDGYGDPAHPDCTFPELDCDDMDPGVNPGAEEVCNNDIDENCDGMAENEDDDLDGFVDVNCGGVDCNDMDPEVNPGSEEVCGDSVDNDCSGADNDLDIDGDGFVSDDPLCGGDDCDDTNPTVKPGAQDVCNNGIDEDCDGVDNNEDDDLDGFVDLNCGGEDCDDTDPEVNPSVEEVCNNGIDDDCDGVAENVDDDLDGFVDVNCGGVDCDDMAPEVNPGQQEVPNNGIDDDCDGRIDEGCFIGFMHSPSVK